MLLRPCLADNWGLNDKNELPAESSENRIIKWCSDTDENNSRYASANIKVSGFHPCGLIVSSDVCDGENNKILGTPKSGIFKQCSPSQSREEKKTKTNQGLSYTELKELKAAMKKAAKKQNSDPEIQLQILTDQLLAYFMGEDKDKKLQNLSNPEELKKLTQSFVEKLEQALPMLDPQSKKLIEPLLKNLKQGKY